MGIKQNKKCEFVFLFSSFPFRGFRWNEWILNCAKWWFLKKIFRSKIKFRKRWNLSWSVLYSKTWVAFSLNFIYSVQCSGTPFLKILYMLQSNRNIVLQTELELTSMKLWINDLNFLKVRNILVWLNC